MNILDKNLLEISMWMQNLSKGGEEWCKIRQRMTSLETNTVRTFIIFWNIQYITQSFFFVTVLLLGFIFFINMYLSTQDGKSTWILGEKNILAWSQFCQGMTNYCRSAVTIFLFHLIVHTESQFLVKHVSC